MSTKLAIGVLAAMVLAQWVILHTQISSAILNESSSAFPDTIRTKAVYAEGFFINSEDKIKHGGLHISPEGIPAIYIASNENPAGIITLSIQDESLDLRMWNFRGPIFHVVVNQDGATLGVKADQYEGLEGHHVTVTANKKISGLLTRSQKRDFFFPREVSRR